MQTAQRCGHGGESAYMQFYVQAQWILIAIFCHLRSQKLIFVDSFVLAYIVLLILSHIYTMGDMIYCSERHWQKDAKGRSECYLCLSILYP